MFDSFIFNNKSSEMFGIVRVKFDDSDTTFANSSEINTEQINDSFNIVSHKSSEPIKFDIDLTKVNYEPFTVLEQENLIKWLCINGEYKEFRINAEGYENIVYDVIISKPKQIVWGKVIGMRFTVTSKYPYGRSNEIINKFDVTETPGNFNIHVNDNYRKAIYPVIEIKVNEPGDLIITNENDSSKNLILKNCVADEILVIDCNKPRLTSNKRKNPYGEFNKYWFRLYEGNNKVTVSLSCEVTIKFRTIRMVSII